MFTEDIKNFESYSGCEAGCFGYKMKISNQNNWVFWENCRDSFQYVKRENLENGIFFRHRLGQGRNVVAFIRKIEEILELKEKSKFSKTNDKNAIWIGPSSFWFSNRIRRSFFTLALRCGQKYRYTKDNFWYCFENSKYALHCMPAIKLFLSGYTKHKLKKEPSSKEGFYELFKKKDENNSKAILDR